MIFGSLFGSILDDFLYLLHHFSSIFVCIDFHRFGTGFWYQLWCFFDTFSVRARNLLNLQKHLVLQSMTMTLPFWETWLFIIFMTMFVTSFGIDFWWVLASILVPFWHPFVIKFNVFWWYFVWWFWGWCFYRFWSKMAPKHIAFASPFPYLFDSVPQVMFLKVPLLRLASFWLPFVALLTPFG